MDVVYLGSKSSDANVIRPVYYIMDVAEAHPGKVRGIWSVEPEALGRSKNGARSAKLCLASEDLYYLHDWDRYSCLRARRIMLGYQ